MGLDAATVGELRRALGDPEARAQRAVIVDLRDLHELDAAAVDELLATRERAQAAGRRFVLVRRPDAPVARTLAGRGLDGAE